MYSIVEVGPRDGLQSEQVILTVEQRVEYIQKLVASGVCEIEVGSFVKQGAIPQLQDTAKVCEQLGVLLQQQVLPKECFFWAFAPNQIGLKNLLKYTIHGVGCIVGVSETFNQKNVHSNSSQLLLEIQQMILMARKAQKKIRVYVSTLSYCPYEGNVPLPKALELIQKVLEMNPDELVLSDTTGRMHPIFLTSLLESIQKTSHQSVLTFHGHDTLGFGLANVYACLNKGLRRFDSSLGGSGGCPYSPGATGNIATEDLLTFLSVYDEGMNLMNKIRFKELKETSLWLSKILNKKLPAKALSV